MIIGDMVVELVGDKPSVTRADDLVLFSYALWDWLVINAADPANPGSVTVGTEGLGLGVLAYRFAEYRPDGVLAERVRDDQG